MKKKIMEQRRFGKEKEGMNGVEESKEGLGKRRRKEQSGMNTRN